MVQTAERLQKEMEQRFSSFDQFKASLSKLTAGDDGQGVDIRV